MIETLACTIVTNRYLPMARVWAESYREHHPGAPILVCVVDRAQPGIPYHSFPFECVFAADLGIPAFLNLAFRYDPLELCTAVKPFLLEHLRDRCGFSKALYFDPDVLILSSLVPLSERLDRSSLLLTPHITEPLDDEYQPTERSIRIAGIYNLGFLGLRLDATTASLLSWWKERLSRFCFREGIAGAFVDQSWMDFAPAMLDGVDVLRDPGLNVAYWNLAHRPVRFTKGRWRLGDRPIGFFHFSGFDVEDIRRVSVHQNRLSLDDRPELRPLFETYRCLLLEAGWEVARQWSYGYQSFEGLSADVPGEARRALQRVDPTGKRWANPFATEDEDSFFSWLVEPLVFHSGAASRLALFCWEENSGLGEAFSDVCDSDLSSFLAWLDEAGPESTKAADPELRSLLQLSLAPRRESGEGAFPIEASGGLPMAWIDGQEGERLLGWLCGSGLGPIRPEPPLTRLALNIYRQRADLREAFQNPLGSDRAELAYWFVRHAGIEYQLHPTLLQATARALLWHFDLRSPDSETVGWANSSATEGPEPHEVRVTRFSFLVHAADSRLRRVFPDLLGEDRSAFSEWVRRQGRPFVDSEILAGLEPPTSGVALEPTLVATSSNLVERPRSSTERRFGGPLFRPHGLPAGSHGVNLVGSLDRPTGVGQVARGGLLALEDAGFEVARLSLDHGIPGQPVRGVPHPPEGLPYDVTLLYANADYVGYAQSRLPTAIAAGYTVGIWFWELAYFPLRFTDGFAALDELWAPSQFCRRAFSPLTTLPIRDVPPCVPRPPAIPDARVRLGLDPDQFYFFFAFDADSVLERKNPLGVIEAFRRFRSISGSKAELLLKVNQSSRDSSDRMAVIQDEIKDLPVTLYSGDTTRESVDLLLNACNAFLSLHRSEGLGLLPIESLYLGKPVISTGYGGVMDYLDHDTGFLVDFELRRLNRDHPPYPSGTVWAEPNLQHAAELMLEVVSDPSVALARADRGRKKVERLYGRAAAAHRLRGEIQRIHSQLATERRHRRPVRRVAVPLR